jgi:hypothetical protein
LDRRTTNDPLSCIRSTVTSTLSFLLAFFLLHPSSCGSSGCTSRFGARGQCGRNLRLRGSWGHLLSSRRYRTAVCHLLNQRAVECLEAAEEDGRMGFKLQTLFRWLAGGTHVRSVWSTRQRSSQSKWTDAHRHVVSNLEDKFTL